MAHKQSVTVHCVVYRRDCLHLKPEPVIVSREPPAVPPRRGDTSVITGVS